MPFGKKMTPTGAIPECGADGTTWSFFWKDRKFGKRVYRKIICTGCENPARTERKEKGLARPPAPGGTLDFHCKRFIHFPYQIPGRPLNRPRRGRENLNKLFHHFSHLLGAAADKDDQLLPILEQNYGWNAAEAQIRENIGI